MNTILHKMKLIQFIYLLILHKLAYTLIAFDCETPTTNISVISIKKVKPCPEPSYEYQEYPVTVKVIQRNDIRLQYVQTCIVEINRLIMYCGMHSHSSIVSGALANFIHPVGAEECRNIHRYKTLNLYNHNIAKIQMNGTTTASITLFGYTKMDGSCKGVSYTENGKTWENVIVEANIKIQTKDYYAQVKLESNEISLMGGITCPYLDGYCLDTIYGETTWNYITDRSCDKDLSLLYQGTARSINGSKTGRYIVVEENGRIFAFSLIKTFVLCAQEIWQTEHPKIMIIVNDITNIINPSMTFLPQNTDLMLYVNSKFLYVEQAYKRSLSHLYIDTIHRRCLMQREILTNRLLLAPLTPNAVSALVKSSLGYVGRILGEVLYVMKCTPRIVTIRRTNKCYHELPIDVNNQSKFMAPLTHIIQNHAEEITCNSVTPPLYQIEGQWIGLTPYPTFKTTPKQLEVEEEIRIQFKPIQPIGTDGLYTKDELENIRKTMTFGIERTAVNNILARKMSQLETDTQGFTSLNLFDPHEMKKLARSTFKQVWGWFTDIGLFMSGIMGFVLIFRLIKYIIGVTLNGITLYKTVGCGLLLLASLWNTLTLWIVHKQKSVDKKNDIEEGIGEEKTATQTSPQPPSAPLHWSERRNP